MKNDQNNKTNRYEEILRLVYDEIYEINVDDGTYKTIYINEQKYVPFKYSGKKLREFLNNAKDFIYKDDIEKFLNSCDFEDIKRMILNGRKSVVVEYRRLHNDGEYYWTCQTIYPLDDNKVFLYMIKDIDYKTVAIEDYVNKSIVHLQDKLKYQVDYDSLTGIYSKDKFYEETSKLLLTYRDKQFVMLRFDIARFKVINEFFGKVEGDEILKYIASKIDFSLRDHKDVTYGRLEADIFCICFEYSKQHVTQVVEYIETILNQYELVFEIIPSFGAYIIEDNNTPVDLICDRANLAVRTVKGNYIKRFAYFDEQLRVELLREQEIINCMSMALLQEQFEVYLQPKFDIQLGKPVGAEALVRWIHPEKGIIQPGDFIPIFERNGFIMKLDAYVWEKVCQLIRKWLDDKKKSIPVSVNISRINLYNPKLCDTLIKLVEKYDISPKLLELEITESAYTENQQVLINVMNCLQDYGFIMMMDDFGSGYSSLNILKEIPVDVLKIDLRFLTGNNIGGKGGNILSSVVRMAKWLNISVVAEGVETKEQAVFLRSIGCIIGQGYLFAKPMPVKTFENYLNSFIPNKSYEEKIIINQDFNIDEFWDPKSNSSLFFNNMVSAVGIYEYNKGNIEAIRLNDQYFEIIGMTREEFFFDTIHINDWIYVDDREKLDKLILTAIKNKDTSGGKYRRVCKNGNIIWLQTKIKYLTGAGDRHLIYAVMNDITKETEATEILQSLFKFAPGGIFRVSYNEGYPLDYANDRYYNIIGYNKEQLKNELDDMTVRLIHPDDIGHVKHTLDQAVKNGDKAVFYEARIICRDGTIKHLLCGNGFMHTSQGIFINIMVFDIDYMSNVREIDGFKPKDKIN